MKGYFFAVEAFIASLILLSSVYYLSSYYDQTNLLEKELRMHSLYSKVEFLDKNSSLREYLLNLEYSKAEILLKKTLGSNYRFSFNKKEGIPLFCYYFSSSPTKFKPTFFCVYEKKE